MAYLLRRLSDKDAWADAFESPLWTADDCPHEALSQIYDNRSGVSMWRVETEDDIERVVAAQAFMRSSIGDFAYLLIEEGVVSEAGIKVTEVPAKTADKEINKKHVDLVNLTGRQVITLARLVNSSFSPLYVFTRAEVLKIGAKLFGEGKLDRNFLFEKGKSQREQEVATAKELLVNLWKKRELDLASL